MIAQQGVIDVIDDTLDVINELAVKGVFLPGALYSIKKLEGGKPRFKHLGHRLPNSVKWAFQRD